MKDEVFIERILQKGMQAKHKATSAFSNITEQQLNWKPATQNWSIAQCLEHLITSHNYYFPEFKKIINGTYKMNFWEKHSPFTSMFGNIFKDQLQEQVKRKMKAPKKIRPSISNFEIEIIEVYHKSLDVFLNYIGNCKTVDLDKIIITSPFINIITYSLRDTFQFLIQHEHRHINQAIRVKANEGFPKY